MSNHEPDEQPLKVDPDAPLAKRNDDEPVEESEPLKDQGDPLTSPPRRDQPAA
jgi:hypothetical protein